MGANLYRGIYTQQFVVGDLPAAKRWYAGIFRKEPYFDEPFYVGFNVAGHEFGLLPSSDQRLPSGSGVYWGVDDVDAELRRLIAAGATEQGPIQDVGHGIRKASVRDPFGNIFGIIQNPHFGEDH